MAPSWASLTPHWMPARTRGQPGSEVPKALSPGVCGTRQGLEARPEAGPARGAWGPCSLPPSPRRCLQTPSCVAASPRRECPQSSTPRVRTSLQTLCIRGGVRLSASPPDTGTTCDEGLPGPGPACPSAAPSGSCVELPLPDPLAILAEGPLRLCGSRQNWAATWPHARPSLLASACQREGNLIFTRLMALE